MERTQQHGVGRGSGRDCARGRARANPASHEQAAFTIVSRYETMALDKILIEARLPDLRCHRLLFSNTAVTNKDDRQATSLLREPGVRCAAAQHFLLTEPTVDAPAADAARLTHFEHNHACG
jgi:hypothetical protein